MVNEWNAHAGALDWGPRAGNSTEAASSTEPTHRCHLRTRPDSAADSPNEVIALNLGRFAPRPHSEYPHAEHTSGPDSWPTHAEWREPRTAAESVRCGNRRLTLEPKRPNRPYKRPSSTNVQGRVNKTPKLNGLATENSPPRHDAKDDRKKKGKKKTGEPLRTPQSRSD
jgi:hypothetical protein